MKLRNKRTGEVGYLIAGRGVDHYVVANDGWLSCGKYDSLAELNEEWEDYEEPENFYIVEQRGTVGSRFRTGDEYEKMFKEIGNYFETKEEAKNAVEKLKAWKRLKDKGFDFVGCFKDNTINYEFVERPLDYDEAEEAEQDLAFLFGGKE